EWLQGAQYYLRRKLPPLDLCVVGSYPFISSIPYLATQSRGVVFVDFGVVPPFGYPPPVAGLIDGVRANRRAHLRHCRASVPISRFIAEDQSRPDSQDQVPISTILLGADHLATGIGVTED